MLSGRQQCRSTASWYPTMTSLGPANRRPETAIPLRVSVPPLLTTSRRCRSSSGGRRSTSSRVSSARDHHQRQDIVSVDDWSSDIVAPSRRNDDFRSTSLQVRVELQELCQKPLAEMAADAFDLLDRTVDTIPLVVLRLSLQSILAVVRLCYASPTANEPFCSLHQRAQQHLDAANADLTVLKQELVDQVRELDALRTQVALLSGVNSRLETELQGEQRRCKVVERKAMMVAEHLRSTRAECNRLTMLADTLATRCDSAVASDDRHAKEHEGRVRDLQDKLQSVQVEVDADRRNGTDQAARIAALDNENARLGVEVDVLRTAIDAMASSVRDAAHDGDTDRLAAIIDGISATAKRGPKRALGTGDDVPVFLRYDGWVPYCPIPKDAVKAACKRVWALKTGCPNTLADVFHTYMIRKEPDTRKRCEFVYNFVDELERYAPTDVECDLFRRVLFQELSEDIIEEQELMASELERCLRLCASNGIVETDMFIDAIRLFFPDKTDARLADLRELVENDATKNGSVQIDRLLPSDDTHQSPFLDRARCQLVTEVVEFRASIEKALWGCADTEGGRAARLTCEDARKALRQVEPHYTAKEVDDMIARGLGTDNADAIDLQAFLKRLLSSGSLMAPRRLYKKGAAVDETVQEVLHRQQAAEYS